MRRREMLLLIIGCVVSCRAPALAGPFLTAGQGRFVDGAGRHVILHGINVGAKSRATNYLSWHGPEDFARMRQWGFNCIRLLIIWAAIEPEPGRYDDEYLGHIDERIAWARANGLRVLVDMHQDLWGEKVGGGDGAPAWATLDQGRPHRSLGLVWSDGYLVSPMVQTAFDAFWDNRTGPGGVGIQDRFAAVWRHVARRYADDPTVIGYDLFNEPIPGSEMLVAGAKMFPQMVSAFVPERGVLGLFRTFAVLGDAKRRQAVFESLEDMRAYRAYVESAQPIFLRFERTKLNPMYQRVADAIRQVDKKHILFLEPCVATNQGVASALQAVSDSSGRPDPLQALAPHAYDIDTDVPGASSQSATRINLIYQGQNATAQRLGLPMLIGEWGAFGADPKAMASAEMNVHNLEAALASDTYWYFDRGIQRRRCFKMLQRPYPQAVAGILTRYNLDPSTGVFECHWREAAPIKEPTRIYVPDNWYPKGFDVALTPAGAGHTFEPITPGSKTGCLVVAPAGASDARSLRLTPKSQ